MLVKIDKNTDLDDCNVLNLNLNIILKYLLFKGLAMGTEVGAAAGNDDALDCGSTFFAGQAMALIDF